MISWFVLAPSMLARELKLSYSLFWLVLDYMSISPSLNSISHKDFLFSGLCWNTVDMPVSLPSDRLIEIHQLAHALFQRQPVTVCWVKFFLARPLFVQMDMHNFDIVLCVLELHVECLSLPCLFLSFFSPFSPSSASVPEVASGATESSSLAISYSQYDYCCPCYMPSLGLYIQGFGVPVTCCGTWSGSLHKVHIALQNLKDVALMQCKMAFQLFNKVLPYIWTIVLLKLIYVIKVVQLLFLFPV